MLVTIEELADMLEVNPNTINNWETNLGLNIKTEETEVKNYSENLVIFFKKVKSLILNGYTLDTIKELLAVEVELENQNQLKKTLAAVVIEPEEEDTIKLSESEKIINHAITDSVNQDNVLTIVETLLKEIKYYTERTIEAEKKVYLLEDHEKRIKEEFFEMSSEMKQLKMQLTEKEQKLKDFEEQKKRLNLLEVQLKLMQLESKKKSFWEFWK